MMLTQCLMTLRFHNILWFPINYVTFLPVASKDVWVPAIFQVQIVIVS